MGLSAEEFKMKRWKAWLAVAVVCVIAEGGLIVLTMSQPAKPPRPVPGNLECDNPGSMSDDPACQPARVSWTPFLIGAGGVAAVFFCIVAFSSFRTEQDTRWWDEYELERERSEKLDRRQDVTS